MGIGIDQEPRAVLWGDSNAQHYVGMLEVFAEDAGFAFRIVSVYSCPPVRDDLRSYVGETLYEGCRRAYELALPEVEKYEVVILAADWRLFDSRDDGFLRSLFSTVRGLARHGKLVILLGRVPVSRTYDRHCREKALYFPGVTCSSWRVPSDVERVNDALAAFASATAGVEYFDLNDSLCPEGLCFGYEADGTPMYFNHNHLSIPPSQRLTRRIVEAGGTPFPFSLLQRR